MNGRSYKSKQSALECFERGEFPGTEPLGYTVKGYEAKRIFNKDKKLGTRSRIIPVRKIEIDKEWGPVVKELYELYAVGCFSIKYVCSYLFKKYRLRFSMTGMDNLLKNRFYIGEMEYEGTIYPHNYGMILDKSLWEKVQSVIIARARKDGGEKSKIPKVILYSKKIRCAKCERFLSGYEKKKNNYYRCCYNISEKKITNHLASHDTQGKDIFLNEGGILTFRDRVVYQEKGSDFSSDEINNLIIELCKKTISGEEILVKTGIDFSELQNRLFDLTLDGIIEQDLQGFWKVK
jgi:hypothetical protein